MGSARKGHDIRVVGGDLVQSLDIVARRADESRHEGLESRLDAPVAGGAESRESAPVEGILQNHDGRFPDVPAVPAKSRHLDRRFVGFRAGVAEEAVVHPRYLRQSAREGLLGLDVVEVGGVHEFAGLFAQGRRHRRMGVTEVVHAEAGDTVQIAPAGGVIQVGPLAVTECHRQSGVGLHQSRSRHRFVSLPERKEAADAASKPVTIAL